MAKLIKISSIVYSVTTILFFMLANLGAGFMMQAQEEADRTGGEVVLAGWQTGCILVINILAYIELLGYFAIFVEVFVFFFRKSRMAGQRQAMVESEKFPTLSFAIGFVFFMLFMSLMRAVL